MQKTLLRLAIAVAAFCLLPGVAMAETPSTSPAAGASASGAPGTPPSTPTPTPPAAAPKLVRARVLTDCEHGKANDLVELPPDVAKTGKDAGLLDTDKAAVAYAATLEQNKPKPKDS